MRALPKTLLALVLGVGLALLWTGALADSVRVKAGKTVKITLPRQPKIVSVEDPSIATLKVLPDGHALVQGRRPGRTRIIGRDFAEVPFIIPVTVTR
jgi:Flp pilus assembly secretin CpaC